MKNAKEWAREIVYSQKIQCEDISYETTLHLVENIASALTTLQDENQRLKSSLEKIASNKDDYWCANCSSSQLARETLVIK